MDTDKHRQAWNLFFQKYIGRPLEEEEFLHYACGPAVENIMRHFFPQVTDAARITALAGEKEEIYRRLCREDVEGLRLIEGSARGARPPAGARRAHGHRHRRGAGKHGFLL